MRNAPCARYTWLHVMLGHDNIFFCYCSVAQPNHIRSGYNRSGLDSDRIWFILPQCRQALRMVLDVWGELAGHKRSLTHHTQISRLGIQCHNLYSYILILHFLSHCGCTLLHFLGYCGCALFNFLSHCSCTLFNFLSHCGCTLLTF